MDSKYNLIENDRTSPAVNGFSFKRKFSNGTSMHSSPNKKQCDSNGQINGVGHTNGNTPRQPNISIEDQRRNLPVYHVRKRYVKDSLRKKRMKMKQYCLTFVLFKSDASNR